jgi:hypothetical protein
VTTDVACVSETLDAAGNPTGIINDVASIKSTFLNLRDTLVRVQTVPAEETLIVTPPGLPPTTLFRKCSRAGTMHKIGR